MFTTRVVNSEVVTNLIYFSTFEAYCFDLIEALFLEATKTDKWVSTISLFIGFTHRRYRK